MCLVLTPPGHVTADRKAQGNCDLAVYCKLMKITVKKTRLKAGDMAQDESTCSHAEDLGSVFSTHMVTHNHCNSSSGGSNDLF